LVVFGSPPRFRSRRDLEGTLSDVLDPFSAEQFPARNRRAVSTDSDVSFEAANLDRPGHQVFQAIPRSFNTTARRAADVPTEVASGCIFVVGVLFVRWRRLRERTSETDSDGLDTTVGQSTIGSWWIDV